MDLASVVAALASVGVRVSGSNPNNNIQGDSSRACPTGLAGPEPSGTHNDPGQHFHQNSVSCTGPRPRSMQNTFESGAQALTGSILMKILLATRDTTTDPLPLFSTRMGRQFLDIEAEHLDIKAIQGRTGYRRAESRR